MNKIVGTAPAAAQYNGLQEAEVGHFLLSVLDDPDGLIDHIRKSVTIFV